MYNDGKIKPVVSQTFKLEAAVGALQALGTRQTIGKVVLTI
jgi:NADPH2:quinone reductase